MTTKIQPKPIAAAQRTEMAPRTDGTAREKEIKAIRYAYDAGDVAEIDRAQLPKDVKPLADAAEKAASRKRENVEYEQFTTDNGKHYYGIGHTNYGGAGAEDIYSAKGERVTGYSLDNGQLSEWEKTPNEASRSKAGAAALQMLLPRSILGSDQVSRCDGPNRSPDKICEIDANALPKRFQEEGQRFSLEEHAYELPLHGADGEPLYADYLVGNNRTEVGDVTVLNSQGDAVGGATVFNNSPDKLKFWFNE